MRIETMRSMLFLSLVAVLAGCGGTTTETKVVTTASQSDVVADVTALTKCGATLKTDDSDAIVEVDFRGTKIDGDMLRHLVGLPKLRSVRLNDTGMKDAGLQHLGAVTTLQNVDLRGCAISNDGLAWLKPLKNLKALRLSGRDGKTTVNDAGLESLAEMTKLKALAADFLPISGDGLMHLKKCRNLEELYLAGTLVDDAGCERFTQFPKLKKLRLSGTQVTSAGLPSIGSASSLEDLDLSESSQLQDDGLTHLKALSNLKRLNLWSVGVTDVGVAELAGLTQLEWLNLDNTKLTDAGLPSLSGMTKLKFLHLGSTTVSDDGLVNLHPLKSLADLKVTRTAVTAEGVKKLQVELPETEIQLEYVAGK